MPTAQQIGSVVKVKVASGGLPPSEVAGAILHHEEFGGLISPNGKDRLVLAKLDGWNEDQLRSPQSYIRIFRNIADSRRGQISNEYRARLLQFDSKTGVAVLAYPEAFEAGADVGFRIARSSAGTADVLLFSAAGSGAKAASTLPWGRSGGAPLEIAAVPYRLGQAPPSALQQKITANGTNAEGFLAASSPDLLVGFVSFPKSEKPVVVPLNELQLAVRAFQFEPVGISVAGRKGHPVFTIVTKETESGQSPSHLSFRAVTVPSADVDLTRPSEYKHLFEMDARSSPGGSVLRKSTSKPNAWEGFLDPLKEHESAHTYLIQIYWPLFPGDRTSTAEGKPFFITLQRKENGIYPVVEGGPLIGSNQNRVQQVPVREFQLESPVRTHIR